MNEIARYYPEMLKMNTNYGLIMKSSQKHVPHHGNI